METTSEYAWHRSSYSGGSGDNCLEMGLGNPATTPVRDSKTPDGPTLRFRAAAWSAFVDALKASPDRAD
ncbi:DUF397 domain-containing protein [Streptomyces parvulus]|uniref:DUF397 domain-containing protein n=1 Tax=Streptomyces parvulus TaxID=146923 RepID=UPI001E51EB29|nr:DUF397 domain-containing protein [Streptomyces parvulus]MCC9158702.1 DUF397 domain-containing protein [Streptomyces parvulus]MCE7691684.1 DUF397 domain-containing protein [Streptomyces parvulus]